jgi:hypothetical protein
MKRSKKILIPKTGNSSTHKIIILLCGIIFSENLIGTDQFSDSLPVETIFRRVSHQNPWLIKEPIRKESPLIRIGENQFFALSLPSETPLYAEIRRANKPNAKLRIDRYDPATGFLKFIGNENFGMPKIEIDPTRANSVCGFTDYEYIKPSFSKVPVRAYRLKSKSNLEYGEFLTKGKLLCGIYLKNHIIPSDYVEFFLAGPGSESPESYRIPHPGFEFEADLNSSERSFYFPKSRKGVLVSQVYPGVGPSFSLLPGDVIHKINGNDLSQYSDSALKDRVMDLILWRKNKLASTGNTVQIQYYRMGKPGQLSFTLKPYQESSFLVPESHPFGNPPYFLTGGLFFTELTGSYLKEFGDDYRAGAEKKLLYITEAFSSKTHPFRERVVILSRVLPVAQNSGIHEFQDLILNKVNGKTVSNLMELKKLIRNSGESQFVFEFSGNRFVVFEKETLMEIDRNILNSYNLKSLDNIGEGLDSVRTP